MDRTGRCLCGGVSFVAKGLEPKVAACHCSMCRRWSGGPFFAITPSEVIWTGEGLITTYPSSEWAERGFCSKCGSSLFYRVTAPGPYQGMAHLALGTLDDQSGIDLTLEYFIDIKPDAYELAGDRKRLTEAEVMAIFAGGGN